MTTIELAYSQFCEMRFPLPSREQVEKIERKIGVLLPANYRDYLLEFNGGYFTEPDIIPTVEECPVDCLTFMSGINATHPTAELASDADLALFTGNCPAQILPIGYTVMGNLILLVTREEDFGQILLKTFTEYFFLTDSIEDFFGLLRERSDD